VAYRRNAIGHADRGPGVRTGVAQAAPGGSHSVPSRTHCVDSPVVQTHRDQCVQAVRGIVGAGCRPRRKASIHPAERVILQRVAPGLPPRGGLT
jgi:hypothetical protein